MAKKWQYLPVIWKYKTTYVFLSPISHGYYVLN